MTTFIKVQKLCEYCGKEFTAKTTVTRFCSTPCASKAGKARIRTAKVQAVNSDTRTRKLEGLKEKEFLTAREAATLLNCSVRSVYYNIKSGQLKAINLGQRVTRIKRSDIDKLFI